MDFFGKCQPLIRFMSRKPQESYIMEGRVVWDVLKEITRILLPKHVPFACLLN